MLFAKISLDDVAMASKLSKHSIRNILAVLNSALRGRSSAYTNVLVVAATSCCAEREQDVRRIEAEVYKDALSEMDTY